MADPTQGTAAQVPTANNPATNRLLYISAGFAALVVIASVALGIGENAETKMTMFKWAVGAGGIVLAAGLTAAGYSIGKLFEGVTPIGFMPRISQPLAQVFTAPATVNPPVTATTAPQLDPLAPLGPLSSSGGSPYAPSKTPPGVLLALLALPMLALVAGGCAGTSEQFKATIGAGVNNVVEDMREYTAAHDWDTNHNGTVEPGETAQRTAETTLTDNLAASVADQKTITVEGVEKAWQPVEPRWRAYVANDPLIAGDAESQKIRNDTGDLVNKLIQVEKERQAAVRSAVPFVGGSAGK